MLAANNENKMAHTSKKEDVLFGKEEENDLWSAIGVVSWLLLKY
jgi:hypothetical protein